LASVRKDKPRHENQPHPIQVSSIDQNADRQLEHLHADKLFTDMASGKDTDRPQLQALLAYAREGDTIVVHSMDRLARNVDDLRRLVDEQPKRGIRVEFVTEKLTFTGEQSPMANLMLSILRSIAQFERDLIRGYRRIFPKSYAKGFCTARCVNYHFWAYSSTTCVSVRLR
jgi:DNA invertase Pin-like site-specific DNA recombinase